MVPATPKCRYRCRRYFVLEIRARQSDFMGIEEIGEQQETSNGEKEIDRSDATVPGDDKIGSCRTRPASPDSSGGKRG